MGTCGLEGCTSSPENEDVVELRFWYAWGGYEGDFLVSLVDEFNATHPHIHVRPTFYNIGDKLLAAIAGGKPPDVATVWDFMLVTMGESGAFLPLEDRLAAAHITPDDYLPNIWEYGMFSQHKWGVPTTLNCYGLYYNRKSVEEAGLDPDAPPRTMDALADWSKRLTKFDDKGNLVQMGFVPQDAWIWFWNFGGRLYDPDAQRFTFDRPENLAALQWMTDQYLRIGLDNWRRFQAGFGRLDSPQNPFFVGKIAMKEDGQWAMEFINEYAPELDYSIAAFPTLSGDDIGYARILGSFWVIPQGTKHPEEAWEFLRWLIHPDQSARFCARLRNVPPLRATLEHPDFASLLEEEKFKFFIDLFLQGKARPAPALPVANQLSEVLTQTIESVFSGRVEPREFLQRMDKEMNDSLQRELQFIGLAEEGDVER